MYMIYTAKSRPSTPKRQRCLFSAISYSMPLLFMKSVTWFLHMDDVISSLTQQQVDIAFLSETKRKGQGNENRNNYNNNYYYLAKNSRHCTVQTLLSSRLLSKNLKIKIHKTMILPVVLYGCETWSLTLKEECRLRLLPLKGFKSYLFIFLLTKK